MRFSNDIAVSPKFIPLFGDFKNMKEQYMDQGKFVGNFLRDIAFKYPGKKAFFGSLAMDDFLYIHDPSILNEFQKLVPSVIDREPIDTTGFGRVGGTGGLSQQKTDENWKKRRETLYKTIGVNFASRFIPIFIKHCNQEVKSFTAGQVINMSEYANTMAFEII